MAETFGSDGHLPDRGVLLHIGPHKTGTTAIQASIAAARPRLAARGYQYPGRQRQHQKAAQAAGNRLGPAGLRKPAQRDWNQLVAEVHAQRDKRVIVSAEAFTEADDERARKIVRRLGGDDVHVVITLRPLAKILPSAWQQYVRNRMRTPYDEWLDQILNKFTGEPRFGSFWQRHRHAELAARWLSFVGPDRLAIVVASDSDRLALMRSFETLLDLPEGFLEPQEAGDNRGLTGEEIELVRQLNVAFRERGWSAELFHHVMRRGAIHRMQLRRPDPDEPRIHTPAWAVDRANEIARDASARIRELGVTVLGDLDSLSAVRADPEPAAVDEPRLPPAAARAAIDGANEQLAQLRLRATAIGSRPLSKTTTPQLVSVLMQRAANRARATLGSKP
jgi:hypothetical protein